MKTAEGRAKNICISAFCCLCPKRVYTTCIWRHNTEMANPQCHITEYKELINQVYEKAVDELKAQREELTRWHDPKEELPPAGKIVLVKSTYGCGYALAERDDEGWWLAPPEEWELPADRVIGWREIHE